MNTELLRPIVNYTITLNGKQISLEGSAKVSYNSPFNRIDLNVKPSNTSLSYFEARATTSNAEPDIGVGTLLCYETSIDSSGKNLYFLIDRSTFPTDGIYRISLYSKSSIDGAWDVTYMLFTLGGTDKFVTSSGDDFEVLTDRERP